MMNKFILNTLITVVALGGATVALAQDSGAQVDPLVNTNVEGQKAPRPTRAMMENRKENVQERQMEVKNRIASTSENRKDRIEDRRDRMASTSDRLKERREDAKDRMASSSERRRERVMEEMKNKFDRMLKRIEATIQRQETIMGKINARISKIKTAGGNTAEAEKFTSDAKAKIDTAKTDLATLKSTANTGVQNISSTTDSVKKETLEKMRATEKNIEKNLKEAHNLLERALGSLKGMSKVMNPNATSTSATTTSSN